MTRLTRVATWLGGIALIIGAGVVVALEPGEQVLQSPFVVDTALGDRGIGRNIDVRYEAVRLADVVTSEEWTGTTNGVWVVVDIVAMNRVEPTGLHSSLMIGDKEFDASDRIGIYGMEAASLTPGIPTRGTLVFEIPRELAEQTTDARVLVATLSDSRGDSAIGTTVDLSALSPEPSIEADVATREAP